MIGRLRGRRRCAGAAVWVLCLLVLMPVQVAWAVFSTTTANGASSWAVDTLDPPTGLTHTRPCSGVATAPVFRSSNTSTVGPTNTSVTINRPSGVVAGDVLLAFSEVTDRSSGENADTPSGWTAGPTEENVLDDMALAMFYKVAGSSEPASYTFSGYDASSAEDAAVILVAFSGANTTTPIGPTATQSTEVNSASITAPSVTVSTAPARLVVVLAAADEDSMGTPSGMTSRTNVTTGTPQDGTFFFEELRSGTGATGTRSGAISPNSRGMGMSILLNPRTTIDPTVNLSWTATTDTYPTGYELVRTGGGTVTTPISGRTTVAYTDSTTDAATAYSYSLQSVFGTWRSTSATRAVAAC